eukprot:2808885-Amphidinium_carterae.1
MKGVTCCRNNHACRVPCKHKHVCKLDVFNPRKGTLCTRATPYPKLLGRKPFSKLFGVHKPSLGLHALSPWHQSRSACGFRSAAPCRTFVLRNQEAESIRSGVHQPFRGSESFLWLKGAA